MSKKQTCVWESISPSRAKEYLAKNINNRPLSQVASDKLADGFAADYQENGDTIKFDEDGNLVDGQHRLTAVVKSGRTIHSWVVRNVSARAIDTIDKVRRRSNGDVLSRRREENYNMLAASCGYVFRLLQGDVPNSYGTPPRTDQMDMILAKYGKQLRAACTFVNRYKNNKLLPPSELAFLVAWGNVLYGDGVADAFWKQVMTAEELRRGTPQYSLYQRLNRYSKDSRLKRNIRMAFCIKAFNSYLMGHPLKSVRHAEGEEFPAFIDPSRVTSTRIAQLRNGNGKP